MALKPFITIGFLLSSTYGGVWAVNNPEKWMNEEKITAYRNYVDAKSLQTITVNGEKYNIKGEDIDFLSLYDMAKAEAEQIIASGNTQKYRQQLIEYNSFFRMIGAEEIPLD